MGHNDHFHRRSKHNRIAHDGEEKVKELVERFSPTAIYSETLTLGDPTDVLSDILTNIFPTTSSTTPATTPAVTPTTSPASPTTTPAAANTTPATTANTDASPTTSTPTDNTSTPVTNAVGPDTSITAAVTTNTATFTSISLPSSSAQTILPSSLITASASVTSSAPSATATSSGSGTNVGGVVGGIAGALIGLAVLGFAVRYVMKRREKMEITPFDPDDFRRSAVMLNNEGPHSGGDPHGGYPEMMEHRNIGAASPAPTFGTLYGRPGPGQGRDLAAINTGMANDHYGAMGMGAPHPYSAPYGQYSPPETANSAHLMYPNAAYDPMAAPYGQNPFSPAPSSYSSAPGTPSALYPGAGAGIAGAFGVAGAIAGAGMLTRQNSSATHLANPHANVAPNPHMSHGYPDEGGYVDLDRSSVTPYQQAQYAEISEKLGTSVPNGLSTPAAVAAMSAKNQQELQAPPAEYGDYTQGPFADPYAGSRTMTPPSAAPAYIPASLAPGVNGPRGSAISAATTASDARPSTDSQDITNDFPVPPSPGLPSPGLPSPGFMSSSASIKSRIDSTPPTLPEIFIAPGTASGVSTPQRVVSYDFPMSVRGSDLGHSDIGHSSEGHGAAPNGNLGTPVNAAYPSSIFGAYAASQGYPSGLSAATHAAPGMGQEVLVHPSLNGFKFPATPSPLASSFGVITPEAGKGRGFADDQDRPPVPATPTASQLSHEIKPDEYVVEKVPAVPSTAEKKRPDTVYDDDDAYGGI